MWRSAMGQRRGRVALAAAAMAAAVTAAAMAAPAAATAVGNDRCRGRRRTARQHRRRRRARRRTASGRRRWRGRRCCRRRRLGGDGAARARAAAEREGQKEEQGRLKGARPIAAPARLSTPPAPSHLELCEMPRRPHTRHPMPASAAHLRGVAIDPARWGHGWTNGGAGPYTRRPPPPAPNTPRDYGKPRSSLERPDPENSRPHTCDRDRVWNAPTPGTLAHMHMTCSAEEETLNTQSPSVLTSRRPDSACPAHTPPRTHLLALGRGCLRRSRP